MKGQQWGAATLPVEHQGHFYDTEMKVSHGCVVSRL